MECLIELSTNLASYPEAWASLFTVRIKVKQEKYIPDDDIFMKYLRYQEMLLMICRTLVCWLATSLSVVFPKRVG